MNRLTLGEILRARPALPSMPAPHRRVLDLLGDCGTGKLGWSLWQCQECPGRESHPLGCGNRHCPQCQHRLSQAWLERQKEALLPVRYYHWVFTLPAHVRPLALQNPKAIYDLLFDAASQTLLQFGRQDYDAELGLTAILHTWGQTLVHHPHLHLIVTGGGLSKEGWKGPGKRRWLFDVRPVSLVFGGKFRDGLRVLFGSGRLEFHGQLAGLAEPVTFAKWLGELSSQRWVVFAKGSVAGPESVLQYLGRYTHRVALSNGRLIRHHPKAGTITFSYRDYAKAGEKKEMTLSEEEFFRRFLMHVLPAGFTKIRHYGLLANHRRKRLLPLARAALENSPDQWKPRKRTEKAETTTVSGLQCSCCKGTRLRCIGRSDARGKITLFSLKVVVEMGRGPPEVP